MWLMLQQNDPEDCAISTGESYSVKEFCDLVFKHLNIDLLWKGRDMGIKAINSVTGDVVTEIDPNFIDL